jgi:glycosyltransferase involved in cell wall biosynthesis
VRPNSLHSNNSKLKVVFFTPNLADNSLGRTYCLWEVSEHLGWESVIVSPVKADVWAPLRGTPFAAVCFPLEDEAVLKMPALLQADLFIAVKPLDSSFGVALELAAKLQKPLLLDIDDPDMEAQLSWKQPFRRLARGLVHRARISEVRRMRRLAKWVPTIVSNPILQSRYGGPVIPHVRPDMGYGAEHTSDRPTVAFVGSNRGHKGLDLLRTAIARLQVEGFTLTVTDIAPPDAEPWENWVGTTSLEQGLSIVANADIVVIPSLDVPFAHGQLPAKLIDAMMLGRAIAVSEIEPMPWALNGAGKLMKPGSVDEIETALRELSPPEVRRHLGSEARAHALKTFVVSANVDTLRDAAYAAMSRLPLR